MIWPLCLALVAADVEKQFQRLGRINFPGYQVEIQHGNADDLLKQAAGEIVQLNYAGGTVSCVLPPAGHAHNLPRAPHLPVEDAEILALARQTLEQEVTTAHEIVSDEVWFWNVNFDRLISQYLPKYVGVEPQHANVVFHAVIGRYNASLSSLAAAKPVVVENRHMLQVDYANGDTCGLTGDPRAVTVFFRCNPDAPAGLTIQSVDEPYTCHYEFVVNVPGLCQFAEFRDPLVDSTPIRCVADLPVKVVDEEFGENDEEFGEADDLTENVNDNLKSEEQEIDETSDAIHEDEMSDSSEEESNHNNNDHEDAEHSDEGQAATETAEESAHRVINNIEETPEFTLTVVAAETETNTEKESESQPAHNEL